jgi:hypothetical protein
LPSNAEPGGSVVLLERGGEEKPKRRSEGRSPRRKAAAESRKPRPHEELADEPLDDDAGEDAEEAEHDEDGENEESGDDDAIWDQAGQDEDVEDFGDDSVAA